MKIMKQLGYLGMRFIFFVFSTNMAISLLVHQDLLQTLKLERPEVSRWIGMELLMYDVSI